MIIKTNSLLYSRFTGNKTKATDIFEKTKIKYKRSNLLNV